MANAKKLPSGSWRALAYAGKNAAGKRQYKSFTAPTKKQAEFMAAEYAAKKKRPAEQMTVGEAIDRYIESKDGVLSPTTLNGYRNLRKYHLGGLMGIQLDKLTREDVQREVNAEAKRCSAKTVSNAHGLLAAALAMHYPDLVLHTTLPHKAKPLKRDLPTAEDVIRAVRGIQAELPVLLAMCLCLRMSEVRGVRKSAVEGDQLRIERVIVTVNRQHIEKELAKTDASRRYVALPPRLRDMILASENEYITTLTARAIYGQFVNAMRKAGVTIFIYLLSDKKCRLRISTCHAVNFQSVFKLECQHSTKRNHAEIAVNLVPAQISAMHKRFLQHAHTLSFIAFFDCDKIVCFFFVKSIQLFFFDFCRIIYIADIKITVSADAVSLADFVLPHPVLSGIRRFLHVPMCKPDCIAFTDILCREC